MFKINCQLTEIEGKFFNLMKGIYEKLREDIILKKIGDKVRMSILITPIQHYTKSSAQGIKKEKRNKRHEERKEVKLFADKIIAYIKNPRNNY